jgi:hypothetical protein
LDTHLTALRIEAGPLLSKLRASLHFVPHTVLVSVSGTTFQGRSRAARRFDVVPRKLAAHGG